MRKLTFIALSLLTSCAFTHHQEVNIDIKRSDDIAAAYRDTFNLLTGDTFCCEGWPNREPFPGIAYEDAKSAVEDADCHNDRIENESN